jgi:AraC-like DNA-binding protein
LQLAILTVMAVLETQTERHLLRARDFIDAHHGEPINVSIVARAAYQSPAHFTRQFRNAFGETPHQYLLTRRMERAAALLRNTDYNVAQICVSVGLSSVGSFTTAFRRAFGESPTQYRERFPSPFAQAMIPTCIYEAVSRPRSSRNRED